VLAAGGIGTARGLAAVLAAGSAGAWVGTAFLACTEAATSAGARELLLAAAETDTAYGRVFDVGQRFAWPPEYGGRALRNAFFDRWVGREDELAGDEVAAAELSAARKHGDFDVTCVYTGQGVALLRAERAAATSWASSPVPRAYSTGPPGEAGTGFPPVTGRPLEDRRRSPTPLIPIPKCCSRTASKMRPVRPLRSRAGRRDSRRERTFPAGSDRHPSNAPESCSQQARGPGQRSTVNKPADLIRRSPWDDRSVTVEREAATDTSPVPLCGCCGRAGRRMAELGSTPGVFICRLCALWAWRRAVRR